MIGRIAQKMEDGVASGAFPGGVLLVHYQGRVIFHEAFGSASVLPNPLPMTRDTLFDLASLTKPLATAAAVACLIQEGALKLGDPLSKFIPEFSGGDKGEVTHFHLLNHSSGLPDWKPYYQEVAMRGKKEEGYLGSPAAKRGIYQMAHQECLTSLPGTRSLYSDIGFILLGEVIEKVAGEPLHRFCYRQIFSKLKAKETFFITFGRRPWREKVIRGWVHDENAYAMGGVAGHAGLFSTAGEVYLLVRLWLDSIRGEGGLDPSLATLFVTCQQGSGVPAGSSWGLGWDTPSRPVSSSGSYFSSSSFGHLGFTGTSIWVDRKKDLVVILLTNRIQLHDLIFQEVVCG
jgi:CubicO group peptidase (beta-lactamase class C family)